MESERRVEVVLINYKRPHNIRGIIQAFRQQTVPCHISLIDAAAGPEFEIGSEIRAIADTVYSWNHNFGPYNRYVPIAVYSHEYTYFHDDDMLPGRRLIEHLIQAADSLPQFGVLGQQGRYVSADGSYEPRGVARTDHFLPVDIVVRGYFVRTKNLPAVIEHRHAMGLFPDATLEDDLLLCTAMSMIHGLTNYLTPRDADPESSMNKSELSAEFARYVRGNHRVDRTNFCRRAIAAGWIPLSRQNPRVDDDRRVMPMELSSRQGFDVNAYWLNRGKTYMNEQRLFTEPYQLQEQFIVGTLASQNMPMRSILEVGCGYGRITKRLAETFSEARITALDLSPEQLKNAQIYCAEYLDRIDFHEYDIYSGKPLPGSRFDTAVAIEVFLHHPRHAVIQLLQRLSDIADNLVNYDWSEDYTGPLAPHVWVHDYAEIYRNLGLRCEMFVEPRKFNGQQQKLFIAAKRPRKRPENHVVATMDAVAHLDGRNGIEPLPQAVTSQALLSGTGVESSAEVVCLCCGWSGERFLAYGHRQDARCPACGSLERHRAIAYYLRNETSLFSGHPVKLLHFAPEPGLSKLFRTQKHITYVTTDLRMPDVSLQMDICDLLFKDAVFDWIICSHVLEHILDDRQALRELRRVLKTSGTALILVPVQTAKATTVDDPRRSSPQARKAAFGQSDHVRVCGRDYGDRIAASGFTVSERHYYDELSPPEAHRYGLLNGDVMYVAHAIAPSSSDASSDGTVLLAPVTDKTNSVGNVPLSLSGTARVSRQNLEQPLVSCICSTYNRPPSHQFLVEEAIESFLRQTYPNKELIVLNDCPGQELICDAPNVRVVNVPTRFPTLGDKHNAAISLSRGELLAIWDDDDLNLPWRLALSAERLGDSDYFNPKVFWFMVREQLRPDLRTNIGFNLSLFRRSAFEAVGRFPSIGSGVDLALDRELRAKVRCVGDGSAGEEPLAPSEVYYIYRWGVSPAHLSVSNSSKDRSDNYERVGMRPIQEGRFTLRPHWHSDYVAATRRLLESAQSDRPSASMSTTAPDGGPSSLGASVALQRESTQGLGVAAQSERIRQLEAEVATLQQDFLRFVTALSQCLDRAGNDDAGNSMRRQRGKNHRLR